MKNKDIVNHVIKLVTDNGTLNFIIRTEGEKDLWIWQVSEDDFRSYYNYKIGFGSYTQKQCEKFCNDVQNSALGTSIASFDTLQAALEELGIKVELKTSKKPKINKKQLELYKSIVEG